MTDRWAPLWVVMGRDSAARLVLPDLLVNTSEVQRLSRDQQVSAAQRQGIAAPGTSPGVLYLYVRHEPGSGGLDMQWSLRVAEEQTNWLSPEALKVYACLRWPTLFRVSDHE